TSWRDKASARRTLRVDNGGSAWLSGRRSNLDRQVGCLHCVIPDVLREHINEPIRISVNTDCVLQLFLAHAYELHVAERERIAALDADVAVKSPASEEAIHETISTTEEPAALTDRQFVDEVGLEAVGDIKRRQTSAQIQISERVGLIVN